MVARKKKVNEPDCKACGPTSWLLKKTEQRSYYSNVSDTTMKWIELTDHKKLVGSYTMICAKCEEEAPLGSYDLKHKPLRVTWINTSFFGAFGITEDEQEQLKKDEVKRNEAVAKLEEEASNEED